MSNPNIKDKRIRIFYEVGSENGTKKVYIHRKNTKLKAYVRQLSASEMSSLNAVQDVSDLQFIINYRKGVQIDMFIEYRGKTYQINAIDNFEFDVGKDIKVRANEVNERPYDEVEWKS